MSRRPLGIFLACLTWLVVFVLGGLIWQFLVRPYFYEREETKRQEELLAKTSADSAYDVSVALHSDAFSGYAFLRSPEFKGFLRQEGIRYDFVDDGADYAARIEALHSGEAQFATFPLNSLIQSSVEFDVLPCTVVYVIDESQGADALVGFKSGLASIQDLDNEDARVVFVPDSPSEFLTDIVTSSFVLPRLPDDFSVIARDPGDVLKKLRSENPENPVAFALWEPQLSSALENPGVHVLLDSSQTRGLILDTLVVSREFLASNPDAVRTLVEAYSRAVFSYPSKEDKVRLVSEDAKSPVSLLSNAQAERIVEGIQWKTTTDNYDYFGLGDDRSETLEDIIRKIVDVMLQTGVLASDPTIGKATSYYFDGTLKAMQSDGFHPAKTLNVISGVDLPGENGQSQPVLATLSDSQWQQLRPVANFQVERIRFPRMSAKITRSNQSKLDVLAQKLENWPTYYVLITGQSQKTDDTEINAIALKLAQERADAAKEYLVSQGVEAARLRAVARLSESDDWSSLNLVFKAGRAPY